MRPRYQSCVLGIALTVVALASVRSNAGGTAYWIEICNGVNPVSENSTGLDDGTHDGVVYRSFDLYVVVQPIWPSDDPQENGVYGVDFGIAGPNQGLVTDGEFFIDPLARQTVLENEDLSPSEPILDRAWFSCALALGESPVTVFLLDWDPSGTVAIWLNGFGAPPAYPEADGSFFLARVTVSADASALGGDCYVSDQRCIEACLPSIFVHNVPNAFRELECLGDITWDGVVDTSDLGRLIASFGEGWGDARFDPRADFTRDGVVDTADLSRLIANFGRVCE